MSSKFLSIRPERTSRLIAFASGKGGVGKTVCTANLSMHIAERHKVLTVDMDLGCGNLNASLGVRGLSRSINDFLGARVASLTGVKTPTAVEGLQLISCSYNPVENTILSAAQKDRLVEHLRSDEADFVLMDLGAGVSDDILDLFASADLPVLVTGPESLALHNAFVFVKSLAYRIVARSLERARVSRRTREAIVRQLYASGDQEIGRTLDKIRERDRSTAHFIRTVLSNIRLHVILNKLQHTAEERFIKNLQQLTRKYVEVELNFLGSIPYDDNVKKSLNDIVPFALEYRLSPANVALRSVSTRLLDSLSGGLNRERTLSLDRPTAFRRLGWFFESSLTSSGTVAKTKTVATPDPGVVGEYELAIRQLSQDLSETKQMHDQEKVDWIRENRDLKDRFEDLTTRFEAWRQRQIIAEKRLEESVIRRDEFIESVQSATDRQTFQIQQHLAEKDAKIASLEREVREKEETIRRLREQLQIVREAQVSFFASAAKLENMRPT